MTACCRDVDALAYTTLMWHELRTRYGVGVVAHGRALRGVVSYRDEANWHVAPNVRVCDAAGDDAAVFFVVGDDAEAAWQVPDVHVGDDVCVYAPRLHCFADTQEGVRVVRARDVAVTRRHATLTAAQRLLFASLAHRKGNAWAARELWHSAVDNYRGALQLLQGSVVDAHDTCAQQQQQQQRACTLRAVLLSNVCYCQLRQRQWRDALDTGHAALAAAAAATANDAATATTSAAAQDDAMRMLRAKTLYRLAVAHEQLREYAHALTCATRARALTPHDAAVAALHTHVRRAVDEDGAGLRTLLLHARQQHCRCGGCTPPRSGVTSRRLPGMYAAYGCTDGNDTTYLFADARDTACARVAHGSAVDVATLTSSTAASDVAAAHDEATTCAWRRCRAHVLYTLAVPRAAHAAWTPATVQYLRAHVRCKTYVWLQCTPAPSTATTTPSLPPASLRCKVATMQLSSSQQQHVSPPRARAAWLWWCRGERLGCRPRGGSDVTVTAAATTQQQLTLCCRGAAQCADAAVYMAVDVPALCVRTTASLSSQRRRWRWWWCWSWCLLHVCQAVCYAVWCGCARLLRVCRRHDAYCTRRPCTHAQRKATTLPSVTCDDDDDNDDDDDDVYATYEALLQPLLIHLLADARSYPVVIAGDDGDVMAAVLCALLTTLQLSCNTAALAHTLQLPVARVQAHCMRAQRPQHDSAARQRLRAASTPAATLLQQQHDAQG